MVNTVYLDDGSWYLEAYSYLGLKHLLHSSFEKSIVERTIEYLKDRTEGFDDYNPCMKTGFYNLSTHSQMANSIYLMHNTVAKSSTEFHDLRRWKYS